MKLKHTALNQLTKESCQQPWANKIMTRPHSWKPAVNFKKIDAKHTHAMVTPTTIKVPSIIILEKIWLFSFWCYLQRTFGPFLRMGRAPRDMLGPSMSTSICLSRTLGVSRDITDYETISVACDDTSYNQVWKRKRSSLQNCPCKEFSPCS
jgi:hypothetical protein